MMQDSYFSFHYENPVLHIGVNTSILYKWSTRCKIVINFFSLPLHSKNQHYTNTMWIASFIYKDHFSIACILFGKQILAWSVYTQD